VAARALEEAVADRPGHVVLAGDLDADPAADRVRHSQGLVRTVVLAPALGVGNPRNARLTINSTPFRDVPMKAILRSHVAGLG
jgi:hypothetical protein